MRSTFDERSAQPTIEAVPLSHLSIEIGHLYAADFGPDNGGLDGYFARLAPWVTRVREDCQARLPAGVRPRISTCFLIDDYYNRFGEPSTVVTALLDAADTHGIQIDYIAREAACAEVDGMSPARLVLDHIVSAPGQGDTGARPPATESGWLCNGLRSPTPGPKAAMTADEKWNPPREHGPNPHAIFMDVELFSGTAGDRLWACAFLATVWQLNRLGLLRHGGAATVRPMRLDRGEPLPSDWSRLPAVLRVNDGAAPFSAYRTMSIIQRDFLQVESAVSMILSQYDVGEPVLEQVARRAESEGLALPPLLTDRVGYVFIDR